MANAVAAGAVEKALSQICDSVIESAIIALYHSLQRVAMPKYVEIRGHRVVINPGEHNPPHVHVVGPEGRASIRISGGRVLKGKCSKKLLKDVREYLETDETHLLAEWTRLNEVEDDSNG